MKQDHEAAVETARALLTADETGPKELKVIGLMLMALLTEMMKTNIHLEDMVFQLRQHNERETQR